MCGQLSFPDVNPALVGAHRVQGLKQQKSGQVYTMSHCFRSGRIDVIMIVLRVSFGVFRGKIPTQIDSFPI